MIKIGDLYFSFAKEYYTLHDINFSLNKNEGAIIIGDKDSGKTSLVRLLLGLDKANSGSVLLNNIPVDKINFKADIQLGYISKDPPFIHNRSVEYNLRYLVKLRNKNKDLVDVKVKNTLISYNLYAIKNVKVNLLNYYDKLMLSIARLSIRNLDLLIIDDIFGSLNEKELGDIISNLKSLIKQNNCAVLITTDDEKISNHFKYNKFYLNLGTLLDKKESIDEWQWFKNC